MRKKERGRWRKKERKKKVKKEGKVMRYDKSENREHSTAVTNL